MAASTDRNLLFGILALQMDFITRDQLVAAMGAWVLAKHRPLGEILVEQGALSARRRDLLKPMVAEHIAQHGGDPQQSLASLSTGRSTREQLATMADPDIQASLGHVRSRAADADDPSRTPTWTAGDSTSRGQRFRVLRPHAQGGLGVVYVAEDTELHREVALKEIHDRHADEPHSRSRFVLEAEITGGLEHPGIVPVYGLGTRADGRPFYAMRFIRGDTLKDAIAAFHTADANPRRDHGERTVALQKLLRRFLDVCYAIEYAHSRGVLHRDLKPDNIILGKYGETLVVDWGLAKAVGRGDEWGQRPGFDTERTLQPSSASGVAETLPGSAIGTPAFMSPEQAAGRLDLLGPASDIYSLGATLYDLLTGKRPFEHPDIGMILHCVEKGDYPPPREVKPSVPAALDAICRKAMSLRPQDRYPSAKALGEDIEHWLADEPVSVYREPITVRLTRWGRRHRTLATSIGIVSARSPKTTRSMRFEGPKR
jgi:eukaryotic-like serine/threonine-protein kinase